MAKFPFVMARSPRLSLRLRVSRRVVGAFFSQRRFRRLLFRGLPLFASVTVAIAQITIGPGGGSLPGDGGAIIPGDGAVVIPGDGSVVLPGDGGTIVFPPGSDAGGQVNQPQILVARGAVAGEPVSASAVAPGVSAATASYQWTISGGRAVGSTRSQQLEFIGDRVGAVFLAVTITADGQTYSANAEIAMVAASTAGKITVPPTVVQGSGPVTATITAATNGDRTFRWSISGDGTIVGNRDAASVTFQPGSPGLKELTCNVTLQGVVNIPVRATVVVQGNGAPVALGVERGSGGGAHPAGSVIHLFAHAPGADEVFARWEGALAALSSPAVAANPHLTFAVPAGALSLRATYQNAPAWTPTAIHGFAGGEVSLHYHVPSGAKGLVFFLHDTGGAGMDAFSCPESLLLARQLVAAGYGVAALSSSTRGASAAWSTGATLANNPDARNHSLALGRLAADGLLTATQPVFFLGTGAGGNAATLVAHQLASAPGGERVRGVALVHAASTELLAATSRVPHLYLLGGETSALALEARRYQQLLAGRGVPIETVHTTRSPLPADRFRALAATAPSFTPADAQIIWSAIKEAGVLDANHYVADMLDTDEVAALLPAALRHRARDVAAQLRIAQASVELSSTAAYRLRTFFDAQLALPRAVATGRIVNFSARSRVTYVGDIIQLSFTLTGPERATVLLRGIGPGLARFRIANPLSAGLLELRRGQSLLATNSGWEKDGQGDALQAAAMALGTFPLQAGTPDAALLLTLDPGSYVAWLQGINGTTGESLVEVYDVTRNATRLTQLTTLGKIHTEGDVFLPGLVVAGPNPRTVVARAVGPGLGDLGYPRDGVLGDPRLSVLGGNGFMIDTNLNWSSGSPALGSLFPLIGAFPLKANSTDAATLTALNPGNYTLEVKSTAFVPMPGSASLPPASTGAVLVDIYEVP